jgi:hypothetical protein
MKTNFRIFAVFLVLMSSCTLTPRVSSQQSNVSLQLFYDELSPYGQWIDYGNYGYVWIPDAGDNFEPYSSDGHWVMTNYGWTWASDYDWGWAPFHYGRWSYANSFGWFWVPDTEWGPAWVNWRQADGYYGWSPMEPGITINLSFNNQYNSDNDHWMFVRDRDFDREDVNRYYVNRNEHEHIARYSVIVNNTYRDTKRNTTYVTGPSRNSIQNATGRRIVSTTIQDNTRPGKGIKNGRLQIYRPQIQNNNAGQKPTPRRVTNQTDVKRNPTRDATNKPQQENTRDIQQEPTNKSIRENNTQPIERRVDPVNTERINQPVQPVQRLEVTPQNNPQQTPNRNVNKPENNQQEKRKTTPAKDQNRTQSEQPKVVNQRKGSSPVPVKDDKSIQQNIRKEQDKIPDKVQESR